MITCKFDAIFFDSGGTLFRAEESEALLSDPTPSQVRAARARRVTAALAALGYQVDEAGVGSALATAEAALAADLGGRASFLDVMRALARRMELPIPDAEAAFLASAYAGPRYVSWLFPDVLELFRRLWDVGPVLGLIANTAWPGWSMDAALAGVGLLPFLRVRICSGDVGLRKPDPAIFHLAMERAGLTGTPPHRILYVGDSPDKDMAGAKAVGWATAWRRPPGAGACADADFVFEDSLDLLPFVLA